MIHHAASPSLSQHKATWNCGTPSIRHSLSVGRAFVPLPNVMCMAYVTCCCRIHLQHWARCEWVGRYLLGAQRGQSYAVMPHAITCLLALDEVYLFAAHSSTCHNCRPCHEQACFSKDSHCMLIRRLHISKPALAKKSTACSTSGAQCRNLCSPLIRLLCVHADGCCPAVQHKRARLRSLVGVGQATHAEAACTACRAAGGHHQWQQPCH